MTDPTVTPSKLWAHCLQVTAFLTRERRAPMRTQQPLQHGGTEAANKETDATRCCEFPQSAEGGYSEM